MSNEPLEVIEVGGKEYQVLKTGRAQAQQVLDLTKWIAKHGVPALEAMSEDGEDIQSENALVFVSALVEHLTVDALIDLFVVMVGCSYEDAEVYFDIATLIDVVIEVYNRQPSLRRLIERFFSEPDIVETQEELSTTSEPLMDGPTT